MHREQPMQLNITVCKLTSLQFQCMKNVSNTQTQHKWIQHSYTYTKLGIFANKTVTSNLSPKPWQEHASAIIPVLKIM